MCAWANSSTARCSLDRPIQTSDLSPSISLTRTRSKRRVECVIGFTGRHYFGYHRPFEKVHLREPWFNSSRIFVHISQLINSFFPLSLDFSSVSHQNIQSQYIPNIYITLSPHYIIILKAANTFSYHHHYHTSPEPTSRTSSGHNITMAATPSKTEFFASGMVAPTNSCPICLKDCITDSITIKPCTHTYHPVCLAAWLAEFSTCPLCRHGAQLWKPVVRVQKLAIPVVDAEGEVIGTELLSWEKYSERMSGMEEGVGKERIWEGMEWVEVEE